MLTPTPNPNPTASGDTFAYAGSLTQTTTLWGSPAPSPSAGATPQPTSTPWVSTLAQTITQNVSIATGQSFAGHSGLVQLTTQESDASQLKTTTVKSQTYLSYAADSSRANGIEVSEIGTTSTDSDGASLQSILGSGNGVLEQLPNVYAAQWTNAATRTDTETDPGGGTITTTYAADGSYQEQMTYPQGGSAHVIANGDGSGVYQLPVEAATGAPTTITVQTPVNGQIQFFVQIPPANNYSTAFVVPDWYPQNPPVLASDTYLDQGSATLPSSCNAGSAFQSGSVEKIVETKTRLDTVFGEYEAVQTTQYTSSSYGLLCETIHDDLKAYLDYTGQSGTAFILSDLGIPVYETTVTETLSLQSAHLASLSTSQRAAQHSLQVLLPQPSLARARMIVAATHAQHLRAMYSRMRSNSSTRKQK